MLVKQPISVLMQMPEQQKVLASVVTASGGDIGAYYERTSSGFMRSAAVGVNADREVELQNLPGTMDAPSQRSTASGQQLFIPVHSPTGQTKGFFVVEKLHHMDASTGQIIIDNAQGGVREQASFSDGHINIASAIASHFSAFCGPGDHHVARHLRQQMKNPAYKERVLGDIMEGMFSYIPRDTEQGMHISRVAPMAGIIMDAINRDTTSAAFGNITIPNSERGVLEKLITLHDVGKVQQQPSELEFRPEAPPPGGKERNYNHPLYSFMILNLPGLEQDALVTADHHQGERKPFVGLDAAKRHAFSRVIALADKLEAMTGHRSCNTRGYTVEEAFAHLTTRIHDDVDPQLVRLLAEQRVDHEISRRFPDVMHSRDISHMAEVHKKPLEVLQVGICSNIHPTDGMESICAKIKQCIPDRAFEMGGRAQPFMQQSQTSIVNSLATTPGTWVRGFIDRMAHQQSSTPGHTAA